MIPDNELYARGTATCSRAGRRSPVERPAPPWSAPRAWPRRCSRTTRNGSCTTTPCSTGAGAGPNAWRPSRRWRRRTRRPGSPRSPHGCTNPTPPCGRDLGARGYVFGESTAPWPGHSTISPTRARWSSSRRRTGLHFLTGPGCPGRAAGRRQPNAFHVLIARVAGESVATAMAYDHAGDCGIYNVSSASSRPVEQLVRDGAHGDAAPDAGRGTAARERPVSSPAPWPRACTPPSAFRDLGRILEYVPPGQTQPPAKATNWPVVKRLLPSMNGSAKSRELARACRAGPWAPGPRPAPVPRRRRPGWPAGTRGSP